MKLISLYIENFGGLSHFELEFDGGLTTINQPNGFGKTTLAEFIRAMLYGFPRKVKTLEKSRRQKYAPWNGGLFGGNLIFEHENQRFRLERTFGATPKGDTFTLIDLGTNRKSNRFSEDIGIELFGLDSDSFERSTYLPQLQESGAMSTAAIQAKLSDLVEDSGDVANFDSAIAALKVKRSALIPYRGSGGAVAEAAGRIAQLQIRLDQALRQQEHLAVIQNSMAQTERAIEMTQAALVQVRQELAAASEAAAVRMRHDQYEHLRQRCSQVSAQIAGLQAKYPAGFPEMSELSGVEALADRLAVLENQAVTTQTDVQAQQLLRDHSHLPTKEELAACRRNCEEFGALQQKITMAELSVSELMQKERAILPPKPPKGQTAALIAAWIICVLGLAAGIALMVMKQFLYGGIGLGIGVSFLIAAILLQHGRKKHRQAQLLQHRMERDEHIAAAQREAAALRHTLARCRSEIDQFLSPYFENTQPQHYLACLTRLEHKMQLCEQAKEQLHQWQMRKETHDAALTACREELKEFFARYGLEMGADVRAGLRQLRDEMRDARMLLKQKQELGEQLTEFRRAYGQMPAAPVADVETLKTDEQQLRQRLTAQTEELLRRKQEMQELRAEVGEIPQLQAQLERWQQKKAEDRENARILDDTMAFLQQAREKLSTSYLGTIQSRFGYYLAQLEGGAGERYLIDGDLGVQLERMGQARELAYFSTGQTDLVMLCMRLALVDAMFKGQETFVILDDPFVNLDDTHTAQAQKLLRTLSRQRQIIYLTCHSSRMV